MCHATPHCIRPCVMPHHTVSYHVSCHTTPYHTMCHATPRRIIPCVMPHHTVSYHVPCHTTPYHTMFHATPHHIIPCFMPCHVIPRVIPYISYHIAVERREICLAYLMIGSRKASSSIRKMKTYTICFLPDLIHVNVVR